MVLLPTSKGMLADHAVFPEAVPDPPVDVVHCTEATPTLSLALPLTAIVAAAVDTIEELGDTIVRTGAIVSVVPGLVGGTGVAELVPPGPLPVEGPLPVAIDDGAVLDGAP